MYCVWEYVAGATKGDINGDVVKLLSGTTDITQLSAATKINKTQATVTAASGVFSGFSGLTVNAYVGQYMHHNGAQRGKVTANDATTVTIDDLTYTEASAYTAYISTFNIWTSWAAAGWSVYDASAGTNAQCIRAALGDDASSYKYVVIDTNTTNVIFPKVYESWNSGTHAGTNLAANSTNTALNPAINTTSGGILYISASARHFWITSFQGGVWGSTTGNGGSGCFEFSRYHPMNTIANAYPQSMWLNIARLVGSTGGASVPRSLKNDGTDDASTITWQQHCSIGGVLLTSGVSASITGQFPIGTAKALLHPMLNIIPIYWAYLWGGDISANSEIYLTSYNVGSALTERIYNGNTYVLFPEATTYRIAVRKG